MSYIRCLVQVHLQAPGTAGEDEIEPGGEAIAGTGEQQFDGGDGGGVVGAGEVGVLDRRDAVGHHDRAHVAVGIRGPHHGRGLGVINIHALRPGRGERLVLARLDVASQGGGQGLGMGEGLRARLLLNHGRVPDRVQVRVRAIERHIDVVAPYLEILVVQRLVDIAEEMHEEFERLGRVRRT